MTDNTLREHIDRYLENDVYPFHMPGHKRNPAFSPWAEGFLRRDLTEIPGMDDLYAPAGVLRDFQEKIARIYGAEEAAFLVNGATAGIHAAVMAACAEGDCLIAARNSHRSVFGAMAASGARPRYVYPEMTPEGLIGRISPGEIRRAFDENPDCRAALVTSPTYEGVVSDVAEIARAAHERGAILIVDEAHGAHFPFHEAFPSPAVRLGADVSIVSFHKTLPCPSQCAALLWNGPESGGRTHGGLIRRYLALTQTSSPSYALMAAADEVLTELSENGERFDKYVRLLTDARKRLAGLKNLRLFDSGAPDISKITLLTNGFMSGAELEQTLFEAGIQLEMSGRGHGLALTSAADTEAGFDRLVNAALDIDARCEARRSGTGGSGEKPADAPRYAALPRVAVRYGPRQALRMKTGKIKLAESFGKAAGQFIAPYPPGIPILAPGEVVGAELGDYLRGYDTVDVICD